MATMKEVLDTAREIYERTMCTSGCCGDIEGALEYIDGAVAELMHDSGKQNNTEVSS